MRTLPEQNIVEDDPNSDLGDDVLTDEEIFKFGAILVDALTLCPPVSADPGPVASLRSAIEDRFKLN
jgi:hypothetical protein